MLKKDQKILFVDLDGSLISTDLLYESFWSYFSRQLFAPFICVYLLATQGLARLKNFLYNNSLISVDKIPYNNDVIDYISNWIQENTGKVILISASSHCFVEKIAKHLGLFDEFYGTFDINLKGKEKLKKIRQIADQKEFEYIGNSIDDVIIWKDSSKSILVNPSSSLKRKASKYSLKLEVIGSRSGLKGYFFKLLRIHQWSKNFLLFLPVFLGGQLKLSIGLISMQGFLAFSLVASAFYIINDLFDIENDRNHPSKKNRPLASGNISINQGMITVFFCLAFAYLLTINLPQLFKFTLVYYALTTFLYSKYLKKIALIDILFLASFYVLRILSGGILLQISISNWLLTFSVFFFLFLACIKRLTEVRQLKDTRLTGRGYKNKDLGFLSNTAYFSGYVSVLVICLYVDSQQAEYFYSDSTFLWAIPVFLLYWIMYILLMSEREQIHADPVIFALKSKVSYLVLFLIGLTLVFIEF